MMPEARPLRPNLDLEKFIVAGLLAAMFFTTLAHGAVEPWSVALFELILIALFLLWAIKTVLDRHVEITIPATALPIGAALLLGIAQSVAFKDGAGQRLSLSLDVEATRHAVTILFFLTASFILAANFFMTPVRLLLLTNVLTGFGALVAAFALIQHFAWDGRFYWLRATQNSVFGPFVNRNHFAGYMAMLIPLPVGLILRVVRRQAQVFYGFAAALMGTAAIVSGSRSGLMSLVMALMFIAILNKRSPQPSSTKHQLRKRFSFSTAGPITAVGLAMMAGAGWIGASSIVERFGDGVDHFLRSGTPDPSRARIWQTTIRMIRDYPLLGAGIGTYHTVFPSYANDDSLFGLNYAHNDYLQTLAETGVLGGIIVVWFLIVVFSVIHRAVGSRNQVFAGTALACGGGIFAIAVQSVVETDLQIPSNALLFLVLTAVVSRIAENPEGTPGSGNANH